MVPRSGGVSGVSKTQETFFEKRWINFNLFPPRRLSREYRVSRLEAVRRPEEPSGIRGGGDPHEVGQGSQFGVFRPDLHFRF
jgi:hypothetical protein